MDASSLPHFLHQMTTQGQGQPPNRTMGMHIPPFVPTLNPIHRMNAILSSTPSLFPTPKDPVGTPLLSKKRKVSEQEEEVDSGDDEKQSYEYTDPKAKRRAQIAKAARKHRKRQKDELIALRAKVKDLKEQIEVLQSSEPSQHNTEYGWKQEAEQHAEIRTRVDQENEFLRKTLMEQMKFIQRLQDYFTRQPLLNMPSLDMILNTSDTPTNHSSSTALTTTSTLSTSTPIMNSTFQEQLRRLANDAMSCADKALSDCALAFQTPKHPTMNYFGVEVQYEMNTTDMGIYFRHHIYNVDPSVVVNGLWKSIGNPLFETKFPFTETVDVLEELDSQTKYIRRVIKLTMSDDARQPNHTMKEESLMIHQKRENPDGSVYFIARSIKHDPNYPKSTNYIRRNQTTTISLCNFSDANGSGCVLMWSARVTIDKDADASNLVNTPDIILKNLFEITPVYVKGIVDRARDIMQG